MPTPTANPDLWDEVKHDSKAKYLVSLESTKPLLNHLVDALNSGLKIYATPEGGCLIFGPNEFVELWPQHPDGMHEIHGDDCSEDRFLDIKGLHCKPLQPKPNPVDSESFDLSVPVPTDFIETINKAQEANHGE